MKTRHLGVLSGLAALAATALLPGTASASTVYSSDECSSSNNRYCFILEYTVFSDGWPTGVCFATNKSEYSHTGRGNQFGNVRYVFRRGAHCGSVGSGDTRGVGESIRNNAAWAENKDTRTHTVYYSPGYDGRYKVYGPGSHGLLGALRNDNASSKRSS
ncbi:hypothetical protein V1J52_13565 [Streptomyces sp. TRM 70351]|uniref:hypothetical protein n=1 Tax=Streptomyces sp. TRM 70351 TaxID=3116552 RepID=UPI002E7C312C|nr:hypothetical protein [Streptomyces sp. TRM 70351]MEE1929193.1 hypothetical protein [Streptomyces sp. TRM 70351]